MADRNALAPVNSGEWYNALAGFNQPQNALSPLATLKPGPEPTGSQRVQDAIYGWLGGRPENRSTASALTGLFDVGTLGMATGAYDGAKELAQSGRPSALAMALMPGGKVAKVPAAAVKAASSAMAIPYKKINVDPGALTYREAQQNNTSAMREMFPEGEGYFPGVAIRGNDGQLSILDGHNRAAVAAERGDKLPMIPISEAQYKAAKDAGYDDMEIVHSVLSLAKEHDAASGLRSKFPGADKSMLDNEWNIADILDAAAGQ